MISPNAGKVLLGADGNPLRGAAGKIVLADNLYPMIPTQQSAYFKRERTSFSSPCAVSEIWGDSWSSDAAPGVAYTIFRDYPAAEYAHVRQAVRQVTFSGSDIAWSRVAKITMHIGPIEPLSGPPARPSVRSRITKSINNAFIPTGLTVRDTWETVATFGYWDEPASLDIEWVINGCRPASLELAYMFDAETCGEVGETGELRWRETHYNPVRVVYNLAEPTP